MSEFGGYKDEPFLAELYDFIPGYAGRQDVEFYVGYARAARGKVLELGCGTGRVLIPVAAAGCEVVGLDVSGHMLARCRRKLREQPQAVRGRVRLVQGDMTDFDLGEVFGLVTTPFRPFQHLLSVEDQLSCLRCARQHLAPGGKLILDLFQPDLAKLIDPARQQEQEDVPDCELPDGRRLRRTFRTPAVHPAEQCIDVELIFHVTHAGGRTERLVQAFPFRYFFRYEVEHLLGRAGFRVVELFGNFDKSPLTDDSPEMIFVAETCDST